MASNWTFAFEMRCQLVGAASMCQTLVCYVYCLIRGSDIVLEFLFLVEALPILFYGPIFGATYI